jgi:16S rRNA G966 N2-methylase RsmD
VLRANLDRLGLTEGFRIALGSVTGFLNNPSPGAPFDLIFLDPPYEARDQYVAVLESLGRPASAWLAGSGLIVAEHLRKDKLDDQYGALQRTRLLQQGDAALSFYATAKMDGDHEQ